MTREQAYRKAMELYPVSSETRIVPRIIAKERAAFMQCFDLMPTGNLPAMRWVKASERLPKDWKWPVGEEFHFKVDGRRADGHFVEINGEVQFSYISSDGSERVVADELYRVQWLDETSAPAPVGVTREEIKKYYEVGSEGYNERLKRAEGFANKMFTVSYEELSSESKSEYRVLISAYIHAERAVIDYLQGTAPVSSAAQPATGYSEAQVRDAIEMRSEYRTDNWGSFAGFQHNPDEIISSLNQKP